MRAAVLLDGQPRQSPGFDSHFVSGNFSYRYPSEADAQSLRVAVLLDELDFPGLGQPDPRVGHIVVELKTANAIPLLRYSCSGRIIGLPTAQLNARR